MYQLSNIKPNSIKGNMNYSVLSLNYQIYSSSYTHIHTASKGDLLKLYFLFLKNNNGIIFNEYL